MGNLVSEFIDVFNLNSSRMDRLYKSEFRKIGVPNFIELGRQARDMRDGAFLTRFLAQGSLGMTIFTAGTGIAAGVGLGPTAAIMGVGAVTSALCASFSVATMRKIDNLIEDTRTQRALDREERIMKSSISFVGGNHNDL